MALGAGAESSQSGSYVTTNIHNFTLVSLASTAMPHPSGLPFRAMVPSHPTHLTTYSTPHYLRSRKVFPAVGTICASPTCRGNEVIISRASLDGVESEQSVGRNRVRSSLVCRRQPCLMTRAHLLIDTGPGCWLDDKRAPPQVIG